MTALPKTRPSMYWRAWKAATSPRAKDRALGQFVQAYDGIVRSIVGTAMRNPAGKGCDKEDLLQAGRMGLVIAAHKWNPQRSQFITMAWLWVKQAVDRAITKDLPVRGKFSGARPRRQHAPEPSSVEIRDYEGQEVQKARDYAPSPEDLVLEREARKEVEALLKALTKDERELLLAEEGTPGREALIVAMQRMLAEKEEDE